MMTDFVPFVALWFSAFTSATLLPGSSEAALLWLVSAQPQQQTLAFCLAWSGNSMGSMVSYAMGRMLPNHKKPSEKALAYLSRYGAPTLLLAWVPLVGDALPLAAGWLRLNAWYSAFWLTLGKGLRYAILLYGATMFSA